jgi:hypothetical protein
MTWTKQRHGPSDHRYIIDEASRFIASMDNEATDEEWALAVASPELLAALTECVTAYETHRDGQPTGHLWPDPNHIHAARAVIAIATAK